MDAINDYYMEELDLSAMKRFFLEQGERRILEKQDYFVRQGERSGRVAYVEDGMFRFVRTDTNISSGIASATVSWPNTPRAFVAVRRWQTCRLS